MAPPHAMQKPVAEDSLVEWRLAHLESSSAELLKRFDGLTKWLVGILSTLIVYLIVQVLQLLSKKG